MKFLVVFVFVVAVSSQIDARRQSDPNMKLYREACISETKVDPTLVEGRPNHTLITENYTVRCFIRCMDIKRGKLTESNVPIRSETDGFFHHSKNDDTASLNVDIIISTCILQAGTVSDKCDQHYETMKCIRKELDPSFQDKSSIMSKY